VEEEFSFDLREKRIAAYQRVTTESLSSMFQELFFTNPKRVNAKIFSKASI
jgi:hypothetical protein